MSLRRLLAVSLALAAAALPACSSTDGSSGAHETERPKPTLMAAREMQYTETFEVHFGDEHVGYLVDVLPVPAGVVDERAYAAGTKLLEGQDFQFLGFISPHGTTYRFDEAGQAKAVGVGSVEQGIAAFFMKNGPPTLISISPGVKPPAPAGH